MYRNLTLSIDRLDTIDEKQGVQIGAFVSGVRGKTTKWT